MRQVNGVLHNVNFGVKVGRNVNRCIGDQQRLGITRHVQHKYMADAPTSAQPGLWMHHRAQQFVAVQAAFHQRINLASARHFNRLVSCCMAVLHIDHGNARQVELAFAGQAANA